MLSIFSKRDDVISSLEYEIGRLEGLQKAYNICVDRKVFLLWWLR